MVKAVRPRTPREEFQKFRRKLLKENNIEHLICARCGEWRHSVHLHHMVELVDGGTNTVDNLIPLCFRCHGEWDMWDNNEFDFGQFLITPKTQEIRKVFFGRLAMSAQSLYLMRAARSGVYSQEWSDMYFDGEDDTDYMCEYRRQNAIFNTYPYSDTHQMMERYGQINAPVVLEDLSLIGSEGALLSEIKSRVAGWKKVTSDKSGGSRNE